MQAEQLNSFKDHTSLIYETVLLINQITNLRDTTPTLILKLFQFAGIRNNLNVGQQDFSNASEKVNFFKQNMGYLEKVLSTAFGNFPSLLVHSANKMTKYLILIILDKLLEFSPRQQLQPFITKKTVSFLSGLLENDDLLVVGNCLVVLQRMVTDENLVA